MKNLRLFIVASLMMLLLTAASVIALATPELPVCSSDNSDALVFDFGAQEWIISNKDEALSQRGPFAFAVPAGKYDVTLVSHDGYEGRVDSVQDNEQFHIVLLDGTTEVVSSSTIRDLPDGLEYVTIDQLVDVDLEVPVDTDKIMAVHSFYFNDDSPNSVRPACAILEPVPDYPICDVETDGGINYNLAGEISGLYGNGIAYNLADYCVDKDTLNEYYCHKETWHKKELVSCLNGCAHGACVDQPEEPDPEPECEDSDNGIDVSVAGEISGLYSDGVSYALGDFCLDDMTVKEYYCHKDTWHKWSPITCTNGCVNGACVNDPCVSDVEGAIIYDFGGTEFVVSNSNKKASVLGAFDLSVPAGFYDVTLVSHDGYEGRSVVSQDNEQFHVELYDEGALVAATGTIRDLPDYEEYTTISQQVDESLYVRSSANEVAAVHSFYFNDDSPNSVRPKCVIFEPTAYDYPVCSDGDAGLDLTTAGEISGFYADGKAYVLEDGCVDHNTVMEYYCLKGTWHQKITATCVHGCVDGACVE